MSHDQRPGRMRVVSDAAAARGNAVDAKATANANLPAGSHDAGQAAGAGGLPILPALVFLLACGGGGVVGVFMLAGGH
ncbi:hypothetical protein ACX40Y_16740 [Sphingomonas sp. RS6]